MLKVLMAVELDPIHALHVVTHHRTVLVQLLQAKRRERKTLAGSDASLAAQMVTEALVSRAEADLRWLVRVLWTKGSARTAGENQLDTGYAILGPPPEATQNPPSGVAGLGAGPAAWVIPHFFPYGSLSGMGGAHGQGGTSNPSSRANSWSGSRPVAGTLKRDPAER